MSAKHTPGPWKIERGYSTIIKSIGPCVPDEYAGSAWLEVSESDARLIAAAPDLLDELRECRDLLMCVETCSRNNFETLAAERIAALNAIDAKATGGQE